MCCGGGVGFYIFDHIECVSAYNVNKPEISPNDTMFTTNDPILCEVSMYSRL